MVPNMVVLGLVGLVVVVIVIFGGVLWLMRKTDIDNPDPYSDPAYMDAPDDKPTA